jgi:hypothetical protein
LVTGFVAGAVAGGAAGAEASFDPAASGCGSSSVFAAPGSRGAGGGSIFFGGVRNGSLKVGSPSAAPMEPRRRIWGVIITTSSVCSFCAALLRNRYPRIGMSPMPGIFCNDEVTLLLSRPAIANVCPSCSSISVSARRVLNDGMRNPW